MNQQTHCAYCDAPLGDLKEIVAMQGWLFCGKTCALDYTIHRYRTQATELAHETYVAEAEIVAPTDVGLMPTSYEHLVDYICETQGCSREIAAKSVIEVVDALDELVEDSLGVLLDE